MSWGDGQYTDYCLKLSNKLGDDLDDWLDKELEKKWKYVQKHANVDKEDFKNRVKLFMFG